MNEPGGVVVGGQRKKKGGRITPPGDGQRGRLRPAERARLEELFENVLRSAAKDLTDDVAPLEVEMWASQVWSMWAKSELIDMDAVDVFGDGIIKYAAKRATPEALVVLRAVATVAPEPYRSRARRHADRLAAAGVAERSWADVVGTGQPTDAWLSYDPIDDDGVSVMIGFDGPGEPSTASVYVDHNLGGIAKEAAVVPLGVDDVITRLRGSREKERRPEYRPIPLAQAAARWRAAIEMTDVYVDPPSSEDYDNLQPLLLARVDRLPADGQVPVPAGMGDEERDQLLAEFLESDETAGLYGAGGDDNEDDDVELLADQILTFSLDYVQGTLLRFSPVMAEMFCLDWAPRKIAADGDGFTLLPDVLAAWIRFVGRRRGIDEDSIKAAVLASFENAPDMIELSQDPEYWSPAKTMALAIQQRGIDMTDQDALNGFADEVNRSGGIDVLAESLVESVRPRR